MRWFISILLFIGFAAITITYWTARLEVPILVQNELREMQQTELNSEISSLSYQTVDAGFTFFINGSFQLHGVRIRLHALPDVSLFAPNIVVTGFKYGAIKGIQINQLHIESNGLSLGVKALEGFPDWFLAIHYYQGSQDQLKNLDLNVYRKNILLGELVVSLSAKESLVAALHGWALGKNIIGSKVNYRDYGLRAELAKMKLNTAALLLNRVELFSS